MKKGKKLEIRVQRVINASHKLLKQEPLFYRTKTKVSTKTVTFYMYLGLICCLCNNYLHVCISQDIKYLFFFFFFFFYQVSETNDPLEDIKSLFEPTTDSIQEQENRTSSFKGVFLFFFLTD